MARNIKEAVTHGLPESVIRELPILDAQISLAGSIVPHSQNDIRKEEDKCKVLAAPYDLTDTQANAIKARYDRARLDSIYTKIDCGTRLTPEEFKQYIGLTHGKWQELLDTVQYGTFDQRWYASEKTKRQWCQPWTVVEVFIAEPLLNPDPSKAGGWCFATHLCKFLCKKYMFLIIEVHADSYTALRITSKNDKGSNALKDEQKKEYIPIYNSSYTGPKKQTTDPAALALEGHEEYHLLEGSMLHLVQEEKLFAAPCFPTGLHVASRSLREDILSKLKMIPTKELLDSPNFDQNTYATHAPLVNIEGFLLAIETPKIAEEKALEAYRELCSDVGEDRAKAIWGAIPQSQAEPCTGAEDEVESPPTTASTPGSTDQSETPMSSPASSPDPADTQTQPCKDTGSTESTRKGCFGGSLKKRSAEDSPDHPRKAIKTKQSQTAHAAGSQKTPLKEGDTGLTSKLDNLHHDTVAGATSPAPAPKTSRHDE